MAAITVDRMTPKRLVLGSFPMPVAAATLIPQGCLVGKDASGNAVSGIDTASFKVVGWAAERADNLLGAANAINVIVEFGIAEFDAISITITMVGTQMYIVDNHTFDETTPANSVKCGWGIRWISNTKGEILIIPGLT
jgi:hypothetical protein